EALPLAAAFTIMSILSPRFSARLGARSITLGASITTLGTIALAVTGAHCGAQLTGWDLAPATVLIGLGQGIALPSLMGAGLARGRPGRAGADWRRSRSYRLGWGARGPGGRLVRCHRRILPAHRRPGPA